MSTSGERQNPGWLTTVLICCFQSRRGPSPLTFAFESHGAVGREALVEADVRPALDGHVVAEPLVGQFVHDGLQAGDRPAAVDRPGRGLQREPDVQPGEDAAGRLERVGAEVAGQHVDDLSGARRPVAVRRRWRLGAIGGHDRLAVGERVLDHVELVDVDGRQVAGHRVAELPSGRRPCRHPGRAVRRSARIPLEITCHSCGNGGGHGEGGGVGRMLVDRVPGGRAGTARRRRTRRRTVGAVPAAVAEPEVPPGIRSGCRRRSPRRPARPVRRPVSAGVMTSSASCCSKVAGAPFT